MAEFAPKSATFAHWPVAVVQDGGPGRPCLAGGNKRFPARRGHRLATSGCFNVLGRPKFGRRRKLRWGRGELARGRQAQECGVSWRWPPDDWSVHMQVLTHRGYAKTRLGRSALVISPTPVIAAACRESLIVLSNALLTVFLIVVFVAVVVEFDHRFFPEQIFEDCPSARDATHEPADSARLVPASGDHHLFDGEV